MSLKVNGRERFAMNVLTLEDYCIKVIVKEIDLYNAAYLFSKDATLIREIEFLRRRYSNVIFSLLTERGMLKERHGDFIVNKYIKELNLNKFTDFSWEAILKHIVKIGDGLEKLIFDGIKGSSLSLSADTIFCHLPNLKVLHIEDICNNDMLLLVSKYCTKLSELNINGSPDVSSLGLRALVTDTMGNTSLKILDIDGTSVSDEDVAFLLRNIPSLEIIVYNSLPDVLYSMHKEDFDKGTLSEARTYNLTKLNALHLAYSPVYSEILTICSTVCSHVKDLFLPIMNRSNLDLCCKFTEVERVNFDGYRDNELVNINSYLQKRGSLLTSLKISGFSLSVPVLAESCPFLKELTLDIVHFQDLDENAIFSFKNLVKLAFQNAEFDQTNCMTCTKSILLSSPVLEELRFVHCELLLTDFDVVFLSKLPVQSLKHISFITSSLEMTLLQNILFTLTSLESLTVEYCIGVSSEDKSLLVDIADNMKNKPTIVFIDDDDSEYSFSGNELYDEIDADGFDTDYSADDCEEYDNFDDYNDDDDDDNPF